MRCPFAHEVRQIQQTVCPYRHLLGFLVHEVIFVHAHERSGLLFCGTEVVTEPLQRQTGTLCHTHNVPAVGNGCTAGVYSALCVHCHRRSMGKYHAGGTDRGKRLAVPDNAGTYRSGSVIACTADYNRALAQSQCVCHFAGQRSGHFAGLVHLTQQIFVDLKQVQQFVRPAAVGDVQQLHAGSIGNFGGIFASEDQTQIVLRQKNVPALFIYVRFVVPYPQDLCGSPAGQCRIGSDLHQLFPTDNTVHFLDLCGGTLVAPDDRLPQNLIFLVQHDQTMHLSGNANALDLLFCHTAFGDNGLNGSDHCSFPVCRILFCVAVFRLIHGIFYRRTCHNGAVFPKQYSFGTAGTAVHANYISHSCNSFP